MNVRQVDFEIYRDRNAFGAVLVRALPDIYKEATLFKITSIASTGEMCECETPKEDPERKYADYCTHIANFRYTFKKHENANTLFSMNLCHCCVERWIDHWLNNVMFAKIKDVEHHNYEKS